MLIDYIKKELLKSNNSLKQNYMNILINNKEMYSIYNEQTKKINSTNNKEKIYCLLNNIVEHPICPICNKNQLLFVDSTIGYKKTCSKECQYIYAKQEREKTNLEKYGVKTTFLEKNTKNKIKETNLKKYNVENYMATKDFKNKTKKTNLKKYNKEFYVETDDFKNKTKETMLKKYNVDNYMLDEKFKHKSKKTNLEKYEVENIQQKNFTNKKHLNKKSFKNKFINEKKEIAIDKIKKFYTIKSNETVYSLLKKYDMYGKYNIKVRNNYRLIENKIINELELPKNIHLLKNDKTKININGKKLELDIYLKNKEKEIAIEYNGLMYHSFGINKCKIFNNKEMELLELYKTEKNTYKNKDKHLLKTDLCEEKNIKLFHIFENEWLDQNKKKIWISILKNELHLNKIKINGRDTYIKELNTKQEIKMKNDFLNNNHIQGSYSSSINLGLFTKKDVTNISKYNFSKTNKVKKDLIYYSKIKNNVFYIIKKDTLVSVMVFGKSRYNKKYNYELYRFCNLINTNVVGAGSKLLKYFKDKYMVEGETLVSYGNRRWTNKNNNFYIKNGFSLNNISKPDYYYFYKNQLKLYHRTNFQKHKIEEYNKEKKYMIDFYSKDRSESDIMYENNYRKIYDSGQLVFLLKK